MSETERSFKIHDTSVHVSCSSGVKDKRRGWSMLNAPDWETFNRILNVLIEIGFVVGRDPEIERNFRILGGNHRYGRWGDLEMKAEIYPAGCRFEFFQNVVFEHPNGGHYDFDRRKKMPYLIGKRFELAVKQVSEHLISRGFLETVDVKSANPDPLAYFNGQWDGVYERKNRTHRFKRDDDGWPLLSELNCYQTLDFDKLPIQHGDTLLTRDDRGYLRRGRVWGGINGRWIFVYGPGKRDFTHVPNHDLFRPNSTKAMGRKVHPAARSRLHRVVSILEKKANEAINAREFDQAQKIVAKLKAIPVDKLEPANG